MVLQAGLSDASVVMVVMIVRCPSMRCKFRTNRGDGRTLGAGAPAFWECWGDRSSRYKGPREEGSRHTGGDGGSSDVMYESRGLPSFHMYEGSVEMVETVCSVHRSM